MFKKIVAVTVLVLVLPAQSLAMVTPILTENTSSALTDATANRFATIAPHGNTARGSSDDVRNVIPISGTLSNLYVRMATPLSSGTSYIVTVRLNNANTALTCTITSASLTCADLVNQVAVTGGTDSASILIDPENTPATQANVQIGVKFEGSTAGESFLLAGVQQASNTAVSYGMVGEFSIINATESNRTTYFPTNGTIDKMYVRVQNAPGTAASGRSRTVTLRKNGVDTGLTCQVFETATTCTELAASVSAAPGDLFTISYTPANTPATASVNVSFRFRPTIDGESIMVSTTGNISAIANNYLQTYGNVASSVEAETITIAPTPFTWRNFYVDIGVAPGSGKSRVFAGRINNATSSLTATIANTATTSSDVITQQAVAAGDLLAWVAAPISAPATPINIRTSAVMYVAPVAAGATLPYRLYNIGRMLLNSGTLILR